MSLDGMEQFRQALRTLLDEQRMSQAELARRLGISAQAVSSWLAGNVKPSHQHVARVEEELDVQPRGSLLEAAGYAINDINALPTVESLLRIDPGLHPEDRRIFLRLIRQARERFARERPSPSTGPNTDDIELLDEDERAIWELPLPAETRRRLIDDVRRGRGRRAG